MAVPAKRTVSMVTSIDEPPCPRVLQDPARAVRAGCRKVCHGIAARMVAGLVAAIHFSILVLEMFLWRTDR
jgi:hypothetical protein